MRQKLVVGNWKMHGSRTQVRQLIEDVAAGTAGLNDVEIAVAPTFLHLGLAAQLGQQAGVKHLKLAAQNLYPQRQVLLPVRFQHLCWRSMVSPTLL